MGSPQTVSVIVHVSDGLSGPLSGTISAGIYNIFGQISVQAGDSLTIEPGVIFKFQGQYGFNIMGYLSALGTETDSIKFILDPPNPTWSGIKFLASADSCRLRYCLVTGSNSSGITCNSSSPVIEFCSIIQNTTDESGGGIFYQNSNPRITNCDISNNVARYWGGGVCSYLSNPNIQFCHVSDNSTLEYGGGGISSSYALSGLISNCLITGNHANDRGGGLALADGQTVEDCIVTNNTAFTSEGGGIYFADYQFRSTVKRCLIEGNTANMGAGIYADANACFNIENCTISRNTASTHGGGAYIWQSNPIILNCIFHSNDPDGVYFGISQPDTCISFTDLFNEVNFAGNIPGGLGTIYTTNFNGDPCDSLFNIFLDPLFLNPDSGDYHLTAESPCIDAGDPESPLDPDSTIADIGAFYFPQAVGITEQPERFIPENFFLEGNHPTPFNPTTTITFGLPVASWVKVEVFDIAGRLVGLSGSGARSAPLQGWYEAGVHEVTFDGSDLPSGIYLLRLKAGDFSAVEKMVLLK